MPKRTRRKSSRPPPARVGPTPTLPEPGTLHYKVVELSTVDEASLEQTVNNWVRQGWTLESVQFAMRESSKRPSMAFVFFTRAGTADQTEPDLGAARERLLRLAGTETSASSHDPAQRAADRRTWNPAPERAGDPWARLEGLAADGDGDGKGEEPG
jgi:hypothetical protein